MKFALMTISLLFSINVFAKKDDLNRKPSSIITGCYSVSTFNSRIERGGGMVNEVVTSILSSADGKLQKFEIDNESGIHRESFEANKESLKFAMAHKLYVCIPKDRDFLTLSSTPQFPNNVQ